MNTLKADNNYRAKLIELVKASGQEIINKAEDLVGDAEMLTDFDIWIRFPDAFDQLATIEVSRTSVVKEAINVMYNQDTIHYNR